MKISSFTYVIWEPKMRISTYRYVVCHVRENEILTNSLGYLICEGEKRNFLLCFGSMKVGTLTFRLYLKMRISTFRCQKQSRCVICNTRHTEMHNFSPCCLQCEMKISAFPYVIWEPKMRISTFRYVVCNVH